MSGATSLDFSALLSAVKPKDRTDQYVILSALHFLGAREAPVTVAAIHGLLSLHFAKKDKPANISGALRKYNSYAAAAEKGPPLKWSLTQRGIEQLRALSGLVLPEPTELLSKVVDDR